MALLLRIHVAVLIGLLVLSVTATARPCRTFFISSYSFSIPSITDRDDLSSSATLASFTEIRSFIPVYISSVKPSFSGQIFVDRAQEDNAVEFDHHRRVPFGFSANDFSSLRNRTKDILSVVVALLFGVGCGALTAATMYLVFSIFANRGEDYSSPYDGFFDDTDEKIESPKKIGYEKIESTKKIGYEMIPAKESV
ncbi:PREDICTED: uncharacterized protein LOC109357352 [Lupinus angustifolius]|uniref:uncharacterized protein LOC109357352 n=1 Tax=Lupinus angustifolius TaxID=3871 RepID=UPI00092ECD52|nr:PREDICTED: uncharacterized protein LOC109357352 [Lupinus angustifolius]